MIFTVTHSKVRFEYLNPKVSDINLEDIAHSLSQICRFTGHTREHFCVTPEMRILTSNLEWVPAGTLKPDDILIAFEENPSGTHKTRRKRKIKSSKIIHLQPIKRPVYELILSDNTALRSSSEHPWLVATKQSRNQKWETTERIVKIITGNNFVYGRYRPGRRYLNRFLNPWITARSYDAGYLSGILDGEGHVCIPHKGGGMVLGFGQNDNITLHRSLNIIRQNEIPVTVSNNAKLSNTMSVNFLGRWADKLKILGAFRPPRLLQKAKDSIEQDKYGAELEGGNLIEIVGAKFLGNQEVIGMETSTHTYFCEGFAAHNSVSQHSCILSDLVSEENQLWALFHDAPEVYVNDLSSPLKKIINGNYGFLHDLFMRRICEKFNLPYDEPEEVKVLDRILTVNELWQLIDDTYEEDGIPRLDIKIIPWEAKRAKQAFYDHYAIFAKDGLREYGTV